MRKPRSSRRALLLALGVVGGALALGLLTLSIVYLTAMRMNEPIGLFTRDVSALASEAGGRLPPYAGALGLLTLMIWASACSLSALVALLNRARRTWLLSFALFLAVLTADDSLSLHEVVGPHLGIPERLFYVVYALAGLCLAVAVLRAARRDGAHADVLPFMLGGLLLAISVGVDQTFEGAHLAEDGAKFLGALAWLTVPLLSLPREALQLGRVDRRRLDQPQEQPGVPGPRVEQHPPGDPAGSRPERHSPENVGQRSDDQANGAISPIGDRPTIG